MKPNRPAQVLATPQSADCIGNLPFNENTKSNMKFSEGFQLIDRSQFAGGCESPDTAVSIISPRVHSA